MLYTSGMGLTSLEAPAIRRVTEDDLDVVVELLARLGERSADPAIPDETSVRLTRCDFTHRGVVAIVGDRVVGYAHWIRPSTTSPRADMAVVVAKAFENRGIGTALLGGLRREAHKAGVKRLELRVARNPKLLQEIEDHTLQGGRICDVDDTIVVTIPVDELCSGREMSAMRWAAEASPQVVGPAAGGDRRTA